MLENLVDRLLVVHLIFQYVVLRCLRFSRDNFTLNFQSAIRFIVKIVFPRLVFFFTLVWAIFSVRKVKAKLFPQ